MNPLMATFLLGCAEDLLPVERALAAHQGSELERLGAQEGCGVDQVKQEIAKAILEPSLDCSALIREG